jgi:hypothetical protein
VKPAALGPVRSIALLVLMATGLLGSGCDYFKPAKPEAPSDSNNIVPDYTSVEATLQTIQSAVEAKGQRAGDAAFRGAFADSTAPSTPACHFFFSVQDAAAWTSQLQTVPTDWTLRDEAPFFNVGPRSLVNLRDDPYAMSWEPEDSNPDDLGATVSTLHRRYKIYAVGNDGSVAEIIAKGYADLVLVLDANNNWVITRWNDRIDPEVDASGLIQKTWGLRRLESQ